MIRSSIKQITPRIAIMLTNQLATLISIPWLVMHMDTYHFGLVATSLILIQLGQVICNWDFLNYINEVWHDNLTQLKKNKLVTNIFVSQLILFIFFIAIIFALVGIKIIILPWGFLIASSLCIFFGGITPLWFYHVNKKASELVKITLISRLIFLALVIFCVKNDEDAETYIYLLAATFMLITVYGLIRMYFKYDFRWQAINFLHIFKHLRSSFHFLLNSLGNQQIHVLWGFALTLTQSPAIIALFSLADQVYRAGTAITSSVSEVIRLNTKVSQMTKIWRTVLFFLSIYILFAITGIISISFFIQAFFSTDYLPSIPIIQIIIFVWLLQSIIRLINYPVLGKVIGIKAVHKLTIYFLLGHALFIACWILTKQGLLAMTEFFLIASLIQLLVMLIFTFKKHNH